MADRAKPRADQLYRFSALLIGLSTFFPITSTLLYYQLDHLSKETIKSIIELKGGIGDFPKEFTVTFNRDWHVLLGGITFGFLCLAAARGILAQQANEMKTYVELGQKTRYFERVRSVADLLLKQDESTTEAEKEAIRLLRDTLLNESAERRKKAERAPARKTRQRKPSWLL